MPDYKLMYMKLFNRVTDAISILQEAQKEWEEAYIREETELITVPLTKPEDEKR